MSGPTFCIDSDIIIWRLRNGARKAPVRAHLMKLVGTGALVCSTISIAEVQQGVDRAVAERAGKVVLDLNALLQTWLRKARARSSRG
jgi:hypothetical protein